MFKKRVEPSDLDIPFSESRKRQFELLAKQELETLRNVPVIHVERAKFYVNGSEASDFCVVRSNVEPHLASRAWWHYVAPQIDWQKQSTDAFVGHGWVEDRYVVLVRFQYRLLCRGHLLPVYLSSLYKSIPSNLDYIVEEWWDIAKNHWGEYVLPPNFEFI